MVYQLCLVGVGPRDKTCQEMEGQMEGNDGKSKESEAKEEEKKKGTNVEFRDDQKSNCACDGFVQLSQSRHCMLNK